MFLMLLSLSVVVARSVRGWALPKSNVLGDIKRLGIIRGIYYRDSFYLHSTSRCFNKKVNSTPEGVLYGVKIYGVVTIIFLMTHSC